MALKMFIHMLNYQNTINLYQKAKMTRLAMTRLYRWMGCAEVSFNRRVAGSEGK